MNPLVVKLREAINRPGLSFYAIAKEAGVSRQSLGRFVRGERMLGFGVAMAVASVLGLEWIEVRPRAKGKNPPKAQPQAKVETAPPGELAA